MVQCGVPAVIKSISAGIPHCQIHPATFIRTPAENPRIPAVPIPVHTSMPDYAEDDDDAAATRRIARDIDDCIAGWCGKSQTNVVAARVPCLGKSKHVETFIGNCFTDYCSLVT